MSFAILLVEDSPGDTLLTVEAFLPVASSVRAVASAQAAIDTLAAGPLPDLVLLDLNLPGMSGHKLLELIRASDRTARIPVLILSSSVSAEDRDDAYDRGSNGYLAKPTAFDDYKKLAAAVDEFWRGWNEGPSDVGDAP